MLGPKKRPKGVTSARPPAKGAPPPFSSVWQPLQPAAANSTAPRPTAASSAAQADGANSAASAKAKTTHDHAMNRRGGRQSSADRSIGVASEQWRGIAQTDTAWRELP